ncbi:COG2378 Predicted transcriptional regulator [Candidatus Nanopelagicaceae bacterium]
MAKQSAPIQEVSRLLDLVPFLSTHSHISLKELAQEFGIDEKAMANELTALSMCGLPGYTPYELIEIFFDSGFVTINNHDALDIPRALTALEVASLLIGLEILRESATASDATLVSKIDLLISEMRALVGASIEVEEDPQSAYRVVIERAIASRETLDMEYLSPVRDEATVRKIDPLYFQRDNGFTYLVAHSHEQGAVRNFRLDRIQRVESTGSQYSQVPLSSTPDEEKISLSLTVTGSRRAIAELFGTGSIPQGGELETSVYSAEWAKKAVIAHSPDLRVNKPSELRKEVLAELENILSLYAP